MVEVLPHSKVYARLQPSSIHGIGCFAIRDIPEGIDPFSDVSDEYCLVDVHKIEGLPPEVHKLYYDFCVRDKDQYYCPKSFNKLDISWYINHSKNPNMICRETEDSFFFITAREIKAGEELTIDYDTYNDVPFVPD